MGKGQEEVVWEGRAKMHGRAKKRSRGERRAKKWLTGAVILWTEQSDDWDDDDDGGEEKRNGKKRSVLFLSTRGQEARNESPGGRGEKRRNQL